MDNIIERIQKLNMVFRYSAENLIPLQEFCDQLSAILKSNIYLFYADRRIFCHSFSSEFPCQHNEPSMESHLLPDKYFNFFQNTDGSIFNVYEPDPFCTCDGVSTCIYRERYFSVLHVYSAFSSGAGILMVRYGEPFKQDEEILCEYTAVIVSLELLYHAQSRIKQDSLQMAYSRLAAKSLSSSELCAAQAVLAQIKGKTGTVLLSSVAAATFVTQSTVSSALKKLESAGVISTRSLGVKGKSITVNNEYLRGALSASLNNEP